MLSNELIREQAFHAQNKDGEVKVVHGVSGSRTLPPSP